MIHSEHKPRRPPAEHEFQEELAPASAGAGGLPLSALRDVKLAITAELGQSTLLVREVLELKRGSVLPLDKLAGEMADLYINGIPFAKGEVVVLADALHVRIAEIRGTTEAEGVGA